MKRLLLIALVLAACGNDPAAVQRGAFAPFATDRAFDTQCEFFLDGQAERPALVTIKDDLDQAGYAYFQNETVRIVPPEPVEFGPTLSARYDVFDFRGLEAYNAYEVVLDAVQGEDGRYSGILAMDGVSEPVAVVGSCAD